METFGLRRLIGALTGLLLLAGTVHAGGSTVLPVTATVLSTNNCRFRTAAPPLDFGIVDPLNPVDVTASVQMTFRCAGRDPVVFYDITEDYGLHESAPGRNRMRHATNFAAFLPYSLTLAPATGSAPKNVDQTLTVTGTLRGSDYMYAVAGSYSDTVVITIVP